MRELGQQHSNLGDLVTEEIRAAILSGRLLPGERLKQEQLAADLGVSRIPVREALRVLEAEGFVESSPGRGSRVTTITPADAIEVLEVRGVLEGLAARLAAGRPGGQEVEQLRSVVREGQAAWEQGDRAASSAAHTAFHLELARAAGSPQLFDQLQSFPAKTEWIFSTVLNTRGDISWNEHEAVVDAIAAGDPERAERLMREHSAGAVSVIDERAAG